MITQFRVQNYKALRDVTLNLTPIHLLIGPNDSGKTSLLEAMAALSRSVSMPLDQAFTGRWNGTDLTTNGSAENIVRLTVVIENQSELRYGLAIRFLGEGRQAKLYDESLDDGLHICRLTEERRRQGHPNSATFMASRHERGYQSFLEPLPTLGTSEFLEQLDGVQLFRWNARLLSLPCALDSKSGFRMQSSGFGLARALDAILGHDRRRFSELEDQFRKLFPMVEALRILPTAGYRSQPSDDELIPMLQREEGKGVFVRFLSQDSDVSAAHLSEGMLLILAYLAVLYSPEPPRLLLVEEPENGIHPERLKEVISILRELVAEQKHTQVVLTSHSPYIVSLFAPEEVTLCHKNPAGDVEVMRLSDSSTVREQLNVFSLGEIWPAEEERIFAEKPVPTESVAEVTP